MLSQLSTVKGGTPASRAAVQRLDDEADGGAGLAGVLDVMDEIGGPSASRPVAGSWQ